MACSRWPVHPDRLSPLAPRRDDDLAAVEELLRFDSPLQMFERWVLVDTESLRTVSLAKGSKVGLLFGSANHDAGCLRDDPERLDLARSPNPHVSFGAGLHYCVGAPLARVELEATLASSPHVSRDRAQRSDGADPLLVFRGLENLTVEIEAA